MRVGLTFDLQTDPTDPSQAEFDPPERLAVLSSALTSLGHEPVPIGNARQLLAWLSSGGRADLVFNIAEGAAGRCREAWVPMLLELYQIPYVGSDPLAMALGLDKLACKRLAVAAGLRTPPWIAAMTPSRIPERLPFAFPAIVKPRYEGSGAGIGPGAIVDGIAALRKRAEWLYRRWPQPILVEAFIPRGELTVMLIGNDPAEALPAIQRPLEPVSRLSCHLAGSRSPAWEAPLELTDAMDHHARAIASTMFEALGCRDMARVDLRVDEEGRIYFLEINPLPSFDPEGTVGLLGEYLGIGYEGVVGRILEAALARIGSRETTLT